MPEYRKLHNRFDMGERTEKLTDFEFRVWSVYRAAADDYGICPLVPSVLKAKSRRLNGIKSDAIVRRAMERLVGVGLCITFEHQGLTYLAQADWQDWEDIRHPRRTDNPAPSQKLLGSFSDLTRDLFRNHPAMFRSPARAGGRETLTLTQTETQTQEGGSGETSGRPRHYGESVAGMKPLDWHRKHDAVHVVEFCDWVCLPNELVREFAQKVTGTPFEEAHTQVLEWARDIRRQWHGRIVPDGSPWDFWKHRWTETHGSSKPSTTGRSSILGGAAAAIGND